MPRTLTIDLDTILDKIDTESRKLRDQADQLVAKVTAEDRDFTKDEAVELKDHQDRIVALRNRKEALERQAKIGEEMDKPGESRTQPKDRKPGENPGGGDGEKEKRAYEGAFGRYLRHGVQRLNEEDREILQSGYADLPADNPDVRAMSTLTGAAGGYTVPQGFINQVEVAQKQFAGILQSRATILSTASGNDLPYPTINDTGNTGEQIEENVAVGSQDPALGQISFRAFLFSSKLILVPITLMQDAGVNVESILAGIMGERLGRITNQRWTTGNGASQPQGIVEGSTLGKETASATAITYPELVDLEHSVDPAYRFGAEWMMHDNQVGTLKKLVDLDGRPIWQPAMNAGIANGAPGLLLNHPYVVNQDMASTLAAGAKAILFGDMSKYFVRRVQSMVIMRLAERYAEKMQVGFFAFMRCDGRLVNAGTNPIKHLLMKAT